MSMQEAFERALRKKIGEASRTILPEELSTMGEEWLQLRSDDNSDQLAIMLLRQRFGLSTFQDKNLELEKDY